MSIFADKLVKKVENLEKNAKVYRGWSCIDRVDGKATRFNNLLY